jgi:ribosomal protein S18 acetylase RimI-like enzyme
VLDSSFQDIAAPAPAAVVARIHLASPADVPFIVDAIVAESRNGHFSCDCSQPDVLRGLWHQIQTIVSEGVTPLPDARNGAAGRAFVVQVGQVNAGFAILVEHAPGSWMQRLELFAMATDVRFRDQGLGQLLVRSLVQESRSAVVYARCAGRSTGMRATLQSCGFVEAAASGEGNVMLEARRPG